MQRELEDALLLMGWTSFSLLPHYGRLKFENSIRQTMDSYVRSRQYRKYLQENSYPAINGYVPVKQEFRNYLPGIVSQSASGMTLFEPFPVVELNNRKKPKAPGGNRRILRSLLPLLLLRAMRWQQITGSWGA